MPFKASYALWSYHSLDDIKITIKSNIEYFTIMTILFILHHMRTKEIVFQSEGTFHHTFFFLIFTIDFNSMSLKSGFQFYTSGDHPVQYLTECRLSSSTLLRAMSSQVLTMLKDGDSMTCLGNIL